MDAPEGATAEEREQRHQALAAEEAARRRARAELAAVQDGGTVALRDLT